MQVVLLPANPKSLRKNRVYGKRHPISRAAGTWPPAPCAGPPGCGCCSSAGTVCPAAPPAPPPASAAAPSSSRGPSSGPRPWPGTPPAPAPTPWPRPPGRRTEPRSRCSVPAPLHDGSSAIPARPAGVLWATCLKQRAGVRFSHYVVDSYRQG